MAHHITDACINCGACEGECPVQSISAGDGKYVIDPDTCIDCGLCAGECPVKAIFTQDDVPAEWKHYIQLNAGHFK